METNGEPEKLYLLQNGMISYCRRTDEDIEYTHTDGFLEKAKEWFIKHTNIPQEIETDEDGEPLAFSYAIYAESRFKAANRIFKDFERYMK